VIGLGETTQQNFRRYKVVQHRAPSSNMHDFQKTSFLHKGILISTFMVGTWEGASASDLQLCEFCKRFRRRGRGCGAYTEEGRPTARYVDIDGDCINRGRWARTYRTKEVRSATKDGLVVVETSTGRASTSALLTMPIGCLQRSHVEQKTLSTRPQVGET
jgi:hypothetical protein